MNCSAAKTVKVLITDDSAFMRAALSRMVESDAGLTLVGTAHNGTDALAKIRDLQPDVITLDLDMPGLSGIDTLRRIMAEMPLPVIIVSSLARDGADITLEALKLGAFDCMLKPATSTSSELFAVQAAFVNTIKSAASSALFKPRKVSPTLNPAGRSAAPVKRTVPPSIVAIGISTGGTKALEEILPSLPMDLPVGILVVQHMPVGFTASFARRLNSSCRMQVLEAQQADPIKPGCIYIAPGGQHLTVRRRTASEVVAGLTTIPTNVPHMPSVDVMMNSVADVYGPAAMGIIMTGMGSDGAQGMHAIYKKGGFTIGQDEATCAVFGMPRSCAELGVLARVVPLQDIPREILEAMGHGGHPTNSWRGAAAGGR